MKSHLDALRQRIDGFVSNERKNALAEIEERIGQIELVASHEGIAELPQEIRGICDGALETVRTATLVHGRPSHGELRCDHGYLMPIQPIAEENLAPELRHRPQRTHEHFDSFAIVQHLIDERHRTGKRLGQGLFQARLSDALKMVADQVRSYS